MFQCCVCKELGFRVFLFVTTRIVVLCLVMNFLIAPLPAPFMVVFFLRNIVPLPTCFIVFSLQICKFTFIVLNFLVVQSSSNVVLLLFVILWGQSCSCLWSYDVQGRATRSKTCFFTIFFKWTCLLLIMVSCLRVSFHYYCLWSWSVFVLTITRCGLILALIACKVK